MEKPFFRLILILSLVMTCFVLCTCGLEVYGADMLNPPYNPVYVNAPDDPNLQVFSFETADSYANGGTLYINNENPNYEGTLIYYKIYNSLTAMGSETSSISSANSDFSSNGANRAISLGYKQINYKNEAAERSEFFTIGKKNTDTKYTIRLIDQNPYKAGFYEVGTVLEGEKENKEKYIKKPYRNLGSKIKNFDFFNDEYNDNLPEDGEEDVLVSTNSDVEDGVWYVYAYAVSYGINDDFNAIYSELLPLGYLKIEDK